VAAPARPHPPGKRADPVEHAGEVDGDHAVPRCHRHVRQRGVIRGDPGVVDQHVDRAERCLGRVRCRGPAGAVARVEHGGAEARRIARGEHRGKRVAIDVGQRHPRAGGGQRIADGKADAAGTAGDEGVAAGGDLHGISPYCAGQAVAFGPQLDRDAQRLS